MASLGYTALREAGRLEIQRNRDEQEALLFTERLRQLVRVRGTLATALDEMGFRTRHVSSDAAEEVLAEVSGRLRVGSLTMVSHISRTIRRYGGSLEPVLSWAAYRIQDEQARRHARLIDEEARRATIRILALAPLGLVIVFRFAIHPFFLSLVQTRIGSAALLLVGVTTGTVLAVLAYQVRKEATVR